MIFVAFFIVLCAALAVTYKLLTPFAGIAGVLIAMAIYYGFGNAGLAMLSTFFLLANLATMYKSKKKAIYAEDHGPRNAAQVLANGGVAGLFGLLMFFIPDYRVVLFIAATSALASATSDTISSEMGMVYGKRFFNIITLQRDKCGADGVISIEGTFAGLIASAVVAVIYSIVKVGGISTIVILIAGVMGNLFDSLLGALLERKGVIGNNTVNFLNTLFAAQTGAALYFLLK